MLRSYVWAERRVQHVGLQSLKVDVSEDGVFLDLRCPLTLAPQAHLGVLGQELINRKESEGGKADLNKV